MSNQLKQIDVTVEFIEEMVKQHNDDLPESATLQRLVYNPENHTYTSVWQSPEWGERSEGEKVVELWEDEH